MEGRFASFLVCVLCACSNDLDALYATTPGDAGDAATVRALPLLPARPNAENRPACEACAADKCADARANCLEDDACIALLRCKGKCSDPACLEGCDIDAGTSVWYGDYFDCVFGATGSGQCSVECASGQNWGCVGRYEYRATTNAAYDVDFRFLGPEDMDEPGRLATFPMLEGATVRTCPLAAFDECVADNGAVLASAGVGAYGATTLTLRGVYRNFLRIEGGPAGESTAFYAPSITGAQHRDLRFFARTFRNYFRPGGSALEAGFPLDGPDRTHVWSIPLDCLGIPGLGLHFAVAGEADPDAAYFGLGGKTNANITQARGITILGIDLRGASHRTLVLEAHEVHSGKLLSRRQVEVGAGWSTQVALEPLQRGEL